MTSPDNKTGSHAQWLAIQEQAASTFPPIDVEQELADALIEAMAAELIRQSHPEASDADIERATSMARGNPVDAVILYEMLREMSK